MNREAIDRWCERGILALVLAMLVFGPLALGAVRGLEFSILVALAVAVMLVWAVRIWIAPRPRLLWPPISWAVLAFVCYAIARYRTAEVEYLARHELVRVLVYGFVFFAIVNNLHRQEATQLIGFTLVFLAMVISFYAVYQFLTDSQRVWHFVSPYQRRAGGTYICPNHLGGFLEMLLPLALAYTLAGRLRALPRIFLGYAALAILAGIAVTVSRGAWLATGLVLVVFFAVVLMLRKHRLPAALLLIALVVGGALLVPRTVVAKLRFIQRSSPADDLRFQLWQPAYRLWQEHPWWGIGPAHFDTRFRAYRTEGIQLTPDRVHNDYLNTLTDWGIVGAALVASAWGLLGWGVAKTWSAVRLSSADLGGKSGSNKFAFVLGATLGLLAILAHSAVDFNMHIPANALLAVALMALLSSHLRFATERFWIGIRLWSRLLVSLALLAGAVYLAPQALRQAREFVWLDRAARASSFSPAQVRLLEHAFAIECGNPDTARQIGEALRVQSQEGGEYYQDQEGVNYRDLAQMAMGWFERAMKLNPYDSRNYSGYGWCLDWLGRQAESAPYFARAEQLDPNNYFNLNAIGRHYVEMGNYAAAKPWFERSLCLEWQENPVAAQYLQIANARLLEAATNEINARLESIPR